MHNGFGRNTRFGANRTEETKLLDEDTMPDRIKILFLAAKPVGEKSRLRLDQEFKQISEKIRAGKEGDHFELVSKWAATPGDLQQVLLVHNPDILHFSGYGNKTAGVALEDESGKVSLLDKRALANLLKVLKDNLRMVVLDACYSRTQAKDLQEMVDFTITMNKAIGGESAIGFASHFYQGLAFGLSVRAAFELGTSQLYSSKIRESDTPKLLVRHGVDQTKSLLGRKAVQVQFERTVIRGDLVGFYQQVEHVGPASGVGFEHSKERMRVIKDSAVHGRFSKSKIKAAVEAVARRHSTIEAGE